MSYYVTRGEVPHKRHTQFRQPDGSLYHEEVMGIHGFAGIQSLLYHLRPPTAVEGILSAGADEVRYEPPGALRHRLLLTAALQPAGDAVEARVPLLANADLRISVVRPVEPMDYWYRYAHGDELIFVHEGEGVLESQFGSLRYRPHDYLVIPTGVLWRILPDCGIDQRMLVVESAGGHLEAPARYRNRDGQFLESAPYGERDIRPPDGLDTHDEQGTFEVRIKARGRVTRYFYGHHPLDVVGWDGHLWPYAFSADDFEPITGRVHQPPPVHQTFEGPGFVVCSFVRGCPTTTRWRSRPLQPLERRLGRGHLLRRGRLHVPPGSRAGRLHGAPERDPARPASRRLRRVHRQGANGRARRDDRHVPAVAADDRRGGARGRELRRQLVAGEVAQRGGRTTMTGKAFETFKDTVDQEFMHHPVVVNNAYTAWFAESRLPLDHLRHFTVQFSVFSNQFLLAALNRVINADTLEAARESKEIVMNELGVIYAAGERPRPGARPVDADRIYVDPKRARPGPRSLDADREGDPALVATTGTVEGGTFRFQAAHFEWLLRFGGALGLRFGDMGKRRHGDRSTLFFAPSISTTRPTPDSIRWMCLQ